jgi:hypothetical protein
MGIPIDIYYLVRFENPSFGCTHHLLLKVTRAEYVNSNENQYSAVIDDVERRRDHLIEHYLSGTLPSVCPATHASAVVGELQSGPIGDLFYQPISDVALNIWVAPTRFGNYWIVFGIADSEEDFWRQAADDEDFTSLEPKSPAARLQVHYLNRADDS